jgi:hypothetical protein
MLHANPLPAKERLRSKALENGKLVAAHACNSLFFCHQRSAKRQTPNAKRQTPNAKRQTPNAKRQTPNAKRQTPNAKRQTPNAPSMTRLTLAALSLATLVLNGCDNRTREAVRWDQIAEAQKTDKKVQKWPEAESPWSNAEHHTGIAW